MINEANKKNSDKRAKFKKISILDLNYKNRIDLITSIFTIQFIKPNQRQKSFNNIYKILAKGGAFILFEKFWRIILNFKIYTTVFIMILREKNNFTEEEIAQKSLSLRGKLESFTSIENKECLKKAGFKKVNTIFKWLCFEGTICVK